MDKEVQSTDVKGKREHALRRDNDVSLDSQAQDRWNLATCAETDR
jgi:hypothetical protein